MTERKIFVGLGELLWDLLPAGKQLGGAPANFAYHAAQLGNRGVVVSRVGRDELGDEIRARLADAGLETDFIQLDAERSTGTVEVEIGEGGQPRYTILENVAWDFLEWNEAMGELARRAAVVCFGSLAQRNAKSRETILRFVESCENAVRIFDINLRQHYYNAETIGRGLELASVAKLNDEELPIVAEMCGVEAESERAKAQRLLRLFGLKLICITRGGKGSLILSNGGAAEHPGVKVNVADTVGAGDAFVAAIAHHLVLGSSIEVMSKAANRLGAYVASQPGAMPKMPHQVT